MTRRLPPLNALRAFEATARHGRMTKAASELHVTHSAISRQVKHLEASLGVPLLEGPKNALRLTEAGQSLFPALRTAFDQIDSAVRAIADDETGPLDVSCLGTFMMRWLIPRLHRFQEIHPQIEVRLTAADTPVDFSRESFDVAIRNGPGAWPENALVVPLFRETFGPVVAPAVLQNAGFDSIPRLSTKTRLSAWTNWMRATGNSNPQSADSGTPYEHFYFMLEAATAGLGICVTPWPLVADDIRAGRLVAPHGFIDSGMQYVALRRPRKHRKSTYFCDWLASEAAQFNPSP